MKNKLLITIVSGIIIASVAGGVAMAQEQQKSVTQVEDRLETVENVEAVENVETIENVEETESVEIIENDGDQNIPQKEFSPRGADANDIFGCHGIGGRYNEEAREDMIKLMEENGLEEMAEYMRNGDYQSMREFMNNLSEEDFEKMSEAMRQNGYNQMPRMMQWGARRGARRNF